MNTTKLFKFSELFKSLEWKCRSCHEIWKRLNCGLLNIRTNSTNRHLIFILYKCAYMCFFYRMYVFIILCPTCMRNLFVHLCLISHLFSLLPMRCWIDLLLICCMISECNCWSCVLLTIFHSFAKWQAIVTCSLYICPC